MAPTSPILANYTPALSNTIDKASNHSETNENNHDPIPQTMGEDDQDSHDQHGNNDDAATIAAGEELKQTTISDKEQTPLKAEEILPVEPGTEDKVMEEPAKATTPEPPTTDEQDKVMHERISSPKKKRGRDIDDDARDIESPEKSGSTAEGALNGSRTIRSGPEKKRPRDTSEEHKTPGLALISL